MGTSFKYLGRVISAPDYDWLEVIRNLEKARAVWRRIVRILIRDGVMPWVSRLLSKVVVQSVLLFGAETWVNPPAWDRSWGGSRTRWRGD